MIKALREMREAAEKEHDEKLRAKTAFTVTSTVGTVGTVASVALAPFTGGFSLFAAAMVGTTFSIAGGVGHIVTDYADGQFQKEQVEKLNAYLKELEAIGKELDEKLSVFNSCLQYLDNESFDPDSALRTVLSSLTSNALALVTSPMMFLVGSVVNNSHSVRLTNSKQTLPDLSTCSGIVIKDLLRDRIVLDLDKHNNTLSKDQILDQIFTINTASLTAVTGALTSIQALNILDTVTEVGLKVGAAGVKPMATAGAEILKSVQISAQEAASLGLKTGTSAGSQATTTAAKTTAGTAGKILSYATVGFSVALTVYEIGSLVSEYGKGNVLADEVQKMIDFCLVKVEYLQQLKTRCLEEEKEDEDEECKCKGIKLKVLYFNARSVNSESKSQKAKMAKIRELLFIHYPNIVAISETWLDYDKEENELVALFQLAGYKLFRQDRNDDNPSSQFSCLGLSSNKSRRGGGLLVAFRTIESSVTFNRFPHLDYKDNMMNFEGRYDYLCNRCPRPLGKRFRFGFALGYRPPNLSSKEDRTLIGAMQDNCAKMCNYDGWAFVADFNCGSNGLDSIGLDKYHHTDFPVTHTSGNGLDQVVYEKTDFVSDARVLDTRVSDHYSILFNMNLGKDYISIAPCRAKTCDPA